MHRFRIYPYCTMLAFVLLTLSPQLKALTVSTGQTAVLTANALGTAPYNYKWFKNGNELVGYNEEKLEITNIDFGDSGTYSVTISNSLGSATATEVLLEVVQATVAPVPSPTPTPTPTKVAVSYSTNSGNLIGSFTSSTAQSVAPSSLPARIERFTVRSVGGRTDGPVAVGVGVSGTTSTQLLVRGIGPSLELLGVFGDMEDPKIKVVQGASTTVASNDNWGDGGLASTLTGVFNTLGVFNFLSTTSKDSALRYSYYGYRRVMLEPVAGTQIGSAMVEVVDAKLLSSTKISHFQAMVWGGTGGSLTSSGFTLTGNSNQKVLIRAIGPGLDAFSVGTTMDDPFVDLYRREGSSNVFVAKNDNWITTTEMSAAVSAAKTFSLISGSKDAAMLVALSPGTYSITVRSQTGVPSRALLQVFLLP